MLARHGRRLLNLLDDTPIVPGDIRPEFAHTSQARQVLNDAEEDLREWTPHLEPVHSSAAGMGTNAMPREAPTAGTSVSGHEAPMSVEEGSTTGQLEYPQHRDVSGSSTVTQPELTSTYQH